MSSDIETIILNDNDLFYDNIGNWDTKIVYNSLNKVIDYESALKKENIIEKLFLTSKTIEEEPLIYIYNTHDTEKYSVAYISDYTITPDVKIASYMFRDHLNNNGISSVVETKKISDYLKMNNLGYYYCYDASRTYIKSAMKEHEYKVIIDLHRDSVKRKVTTYTKDDKKYAKVMFVLATKNKYYKNNEEFINKINTKLNESYKGLSRGVYRRDDVIFNQDLSPKAMLIELGGVDNTIDELNNTLEVLAKVLKEVLDEEKQ